MAEIHQSTSAAKSAALRALSPPTPPATALGITLDDRLGSIAPSSFASRRLDASLPSQTSTPFGSVPVSVLPSTAGASPAPSTGARERNAALPSGAQPTALIRSAQSPYQVRDATGNGIFEMYHAGVAAPIGAGNEWQTIFKTLSGGPAKDFISQGPPQAQILETTSLAAGPTGLSQGPAIYSAVKAPESFSAITRAPAIVRHTLDMKTAGAGIGPRIFDTQKSFDVDVGSAAISAPACMAQPWESKDNTLQPLLAQQPSHDAELYGSTDAPMVHGAGMRRGLNFQALAMTFFIPWVLFSALFAVRSFSFHYQQPFLTRLLAGVALVAIFAGGVIAASTRQKHATGEEDEAPCWSLFLVATCFLAWILAVVLGDLNFFGNMQPLYDILNLNSYSAIDPSQTSGQQVMDAGRIVFSRDARLDLSKAMGFKNLDTYCVAPITVGNSSVGTLPLAAYDFWAVGVNCCSGSPGDFWCGEFNNPHAHAGLRLMRDEQRPFFRLAVQQAEAMRGVSAVYPIFLYWLQDPNIEAYAYQEEGVRYFLLGMFAHFSFQLLLVGAVLFLSGSTSP